MAVIHSPLSDSDSEACATALQATLVDVLAVRELAQQAGWTVVGTNAQDLRRSFYELRESLGRTADVVAHRSAALGVAPDGRPATVAAQSEIGPPWDGWLEVAESVSRVIDGLSMCIVNARSRIPVLTAGDPVSAQVMVTALASLEEWNWQWQSAGANWISRGRHGS